MLLEKLRREERMWGGGFELKGQRGGREGRKPETGRHHGRYLSCFVPSRGRLRSEKPWGGLGVRSVAGRGAFTINQGQTLMGSKN